MDRIKVCFARLCARGAHTHEVGTILSAAALAAQSDPRLENLYCPVLEQYPTDTARNAVVALARSHRCGLLFMVDDDMAPAPGFFVVAVDFLLSQSVPSVVASPYVTAPPWESVIAHEYRTDPRYAVRVGRIAREDAARRRGLERVPNAGTGYIGYHMGVFDAFERHYGHQVFYGYGYDADHTRAIETEDCQNVRRMHRAGVPVWVHWDHWSGHCKTKKCGKPIRCFESPGDNPLTSGHEHANRRAAGQPGR